MATIAGPAYSQADAPLAAIDWLSQSVDAPAQPQDPARQTIDEPAVAGTATSPGVTVTALDAPSADPIGLLPTSVTGLPRDLWAGSQASDLATLMGGQRVTGIPAAQQLLRQLILAQADAPMTSGDPNALFLARIDKLLDMGALDPALELLNQVDTKTPAIFRRWFDVALLTGTEDEACAYMRDTPSTAPSSTTRIFCLARNGDWSAAALTLNTHIALGDIDDEMADLLARFLDPDLYEDEAPLPAPDRISPLVFRMREAIGEALATTPLPRAFAHADLRSTVGWKSQLEAAERLSRSGAIAPNSLQGLYLARKPAASGGIWDRVAAVQQLDTALRADSANAIIAALPAAWGAMTKARTEVAFATLYGPDLIASGVDDPLAHRLALLSPEYETHAQSIADPDFATTVAMGAPKGAKTALERAIAEVFDTASPDPVLTELAASGQLGAALLQSLASLNASAGDMVTLSETLAFWRSVGLEDLTRRASLQLLLQERAQ